MSTTTSTPPAFTGSCMCKATSYTSTTLPIRLTSCYCLTCRRLSGSNYITFLSLPRSAITWTSGESSSLISTSYSDMAVRSHCAKCGSHLTMSYHFEKDDVGVALGSVDEDSVNGKFPSVEKHIFLGEMGALGGFKVPDDGAKRFEGHTDVFAKVIEKWHMDVKDGRWIHPNLKW